MNGPEATLAVCRFVHDAASLLLWGAFAFLAALVPRDLAREVGRRLNAVRLTAGLLAIGTAALTLPLQVAEIGDGWGALLVPDTIAAVLFDTGVGRAWQMQMAAALLLAAGLVALERFQPAVTATGAGLLLVSLAFTGHAVMHEGWLGVAHRLNDAAHVLAGGAWLGALVPLLIILPMLDVPARRGQAGVALRRFSTAGHAAVALVIATGVLNTLMILGRWPTDLQSPYQALLFAKILLVAAMTVLALANRYILVPRMAHDPGGSVRALRRATLAEIALGVAAIACVSVFGLLEPA